VGSNIVLRSIAFAGIHHQRVSRLAGADGG
jgi:hypothetical protein